ncbi:MAG: non-ribosomal peptide synthetase, partial [Blastocatellia bacterium]
IDMVVALMGILKAGAAYVPLDSIYPESRILTILADAEVSVLLTCSGFWKDSSSSLTFAIDLESRWEEIAQECDECPQSGAGSDNMAYVIYTSGSTGAPKGVEVTHGSVVNLLQAVAKHPGLCEQDILLSVTTITFDIAGLELFLPMSVGARTALATREVASDPESLVREIALSQATMMQATPATWRGLCDSLSGTADLKMLAGGEEIDPALASSLVGRGRGTVLWNLYGPTETTIWSSAWLVEDVRPPIPIGRPIDNTQLYVVDQDCQLLPIGVCGQLAISGRGLARGYLGLPEQTAEKFFPDPQADLPGGRMYQTGDIVRFRRDGALEYQGRRDSQVKVRGHRIDLEEIESVIRRHSAVRDVVVVARRGQSNDIRLAAYVASPSDLSISDLRNYVRGRLPEYMVPSSFVRLVSLPLTPNGKINRKLLQSRIPEEPEARGPETPPRTPIEAALATIWKDILGEKRLDVGDNFFDVGGHSILANQVVSRVHSEFGVRLPLLSVFESPTLVEFTVAIAKKQAEKVDIRQVEAILDELETGRLNSQ